jgi:hypothetical protein
MGTRRQEEGNMGRRGREAGAIVTHAPVLFAAGEGGRETAGRMHCWPMRKEI